VVGAKSRRKLHCYK